MLTDGHSQRLWQERNFSVLKEREIHGRSSLFDVPVGNLAAATVPTVQGSGPLVSELSEAKQVSRNPVL